PRQRYRQPHRTAPAAKPATITQYSVCARQDKLKTTDFISPHTASTAPVSAPPLQQGPNYSTLSAVRVIPENSCATAGAAGRSSRPASDGFPIVQCFAPGRRCGPGPARE